VLQATLYNNKLRVKNKKHHFGIRAQYLYWLI
jgi:hypothetical protein